MNARNRGAQALPEAFALLTNEGLSRGSARARQAASLAQSDDLRDRLRPRSHPALVTPADLLRPELGSASTVERAHAFGRAELMTDDGHQVDAELIDIGSDFPDGLCSVGVDDDTRARCAKRFARA